MPEAYHMYSDVDDVMYGTGMARPDDDVLERFVMDASMEIDSRLGFKYKTPLKFTRVVNGSVTYVDENVKETYTPSYLLIRRLSNLIASGRYILAVTSPEEDRVVHQYGMKLLRDAEAILGQITANRTELEIEELPNDQEESPYGLLVRNREARSYVQSFEDQPRNFNPGAESTPEPYRNPYNHQIQVVRERRPWA